MCVCVLYPLTQGRHMHALKCDYHQVDALIFGYFNTRSVFCLWHKPNASVKILERLSLFSLFFSSWLNGSGAEKVCSLCHNEKLISHDLPFSHTLIVCVLRTEKVP